MQKLNAAFRLVMLCAPLALLACADAMPTGAAVRTYNILLGERRRVGAALIAVD